jgi:hypothetical protein
VEVTAKREFLVSATNGSAHDLERLVLNELCRGGLELTAMQVAAIEPDNPPGLGVSVGDDLASNALKGDFEFSSTLLTLSLFLPR